MIAISAGAAPLLIIQLVFAQSARVQSSQIEPLFEHRPHKSVACVSCHESTDGHGTVKITTAANCSGCHHSQANSKTCTTCHTASKLKQEYTRAVAFKVAGRTATRNVLFDHGRHINDDCLSCHVKGPRMSVKVDCASCHDRHHTEARTCTSCHTQAQSVKVHTRNVHRTCAGSGCHQTTVKTGALRTQRAVCLTCHTDKVKHEPAGDCASCHMIPNKSSNARAAK